jgi:hypothetical protein
MRSCLCSHTSESARRRTHFALALVFTPPSPVHQRTRNSDDNVTIATVRLPLPLPSPTLDPTIACKVDLVSTVSKYCNNVINF